MLLWANEAISRRHFWQMCFLSQQQREELELMAFVLDRVNKTMLKDALRLTSDDVDELRSLLRDDHHGVCLIIRILQRDRGSQTGRRPAPRCRRHHTVDWAVRNRVSVMHVVGDTLNRLSAMLSNARRHNWVWRPRTFPQSRLPCTGLARRTDAFPGHLLYKSNWFRDSLFHFFGFWLYAFYRYCICCRQSVELWIGIYFIEWVTVIVSVFCIRHRTVIRVVSVNKCVVGNVIEVCLPFV